MRKQLKLATDPKLHRVYLDYEYPVDPSAPETIQDLENAAASSFYNRNDKYANHILLQTKK